eukprot:1442532-Prymnesium_polylepis.2
MAVWLAAVSLRPMRTGALRAHARTLVRTRSTAAAAVGPRAIARGALSQHRMTASHSGPHPSDSTDEQLLPGDGDGDDKASQPDEVMYELDDGESAPGAPSAGARRGGAPLRGGHVYFVSTPIGNLEDMTLRAIRTLDEADLIASEDTRVTASLLRHLGIRRKRLVSHHEHNVARSVPLLLQALAANQSVALVSDAGTPGISDPGYALAAECAARGHGVVSVP